MMGAHYPGHLSNPLPRCERSEAFSHRITVRFVHMPQSVNAGCTFSLNAPLCSRPSARHDQTLPRLSLPRVMPRLIVAISLLTPLTAAVSQRPKRELADCWSSLRRRRYRPACESRCGCRSQGDIPRNSARRYVSVRSHSCRIASCTPQLHLIKCTTPSNALHA